MSHVTKCDECGEAREYRVQSGLWLEVAYLSTRDTQKWHFCSHDCLREYYVEFCARRITTESQRQRNLIANGNGT